VSFMPGQIYTIELQGSTSTSLSLDSIYSFKLLQLTPPSAPCTESLSLDSYAFGAGPQPTTSRCIFETLEDAT
jgi:hypothetical protein